ncbi:MAG: outer membrane protein assembly factor, partial [bacterium]|nr:outer membrane protein assembly factor [bacterium]
PRYRFGEVRFVQDVLDSEFLTRYLRFRPGDPFSHEQLLTLQSNLIGSEYFSHVEVRTMRDEAVGGRVPIEVVLTPDKPNRYRAGLGFSTDTGPRITLDWKRRRIGREGHRMLSELRLSAPHSSLKTEYIIPLERPSKDSLSFSAQGDHFDTDTRRGVRLLLNGSQSVEQENDWRRTI